MTRRPTVQPALISRPLRSGAARGRLLRFAFVAPTLAVLALVLGWPLVDAVRWSLYSGLSSRRTFVGLENFRALLSDPIYRFAFLNTFKFSLLGVAGHLVVGFLAALVLHRLRRWGALSRVLLTLPWFIPGAVVAVIWKLLLDTHFGVLNYVLTSLHLVRENLSWMSSPALAMPAVLLAYTWRNYPFVMINIYAGLQTIPAEQYEAARIDGANPAREFWHITLPNLRYILVAILTLDTIWTLKEFDMIYVLTGGGPLYYSEVLSTLVYKAAFQNFDFGYGSAIAVSMLAVIVILTGLYLKLLKPAEAVR